MTTSSWINICALTDIPRNTGVCAQHQGKQIAVFHILARGSNPQSLIKAVSNFDPFSKANVLSRGLITETEDRYGIASPLLKQQFCLDSGVCEQHKDITIDTFESRIHEGFVQLKELY